MVAANPSENDSPVAERERGYAPHDEIGRSSILSLSFLSDRIQIGMFTATLVLLDNPIAPRRLIEFSMSEQMIGF